MKRYSKDKNINQKVYDLLKLGWIVKNGSKHPSIISPEGSRLTVPSTPSDYRAWRNFYKEVKQLTTGNVR